MINFKHKNLQSKNLPQANFFAEEIFLTDVQYIQYYFERYPGEIDIIKCKMQYEIEYFLSWH